MCIVSMVHDYGSKLPGDTWKNPGALPTFEDIVKKASEFDRLAKQPECFDPEKLKFLEEIIAKQPAERPEDEIARLKRAMNDRDAALKELSAQVDDNLQRAKRAEAALAAATKDNLALKDDLKGAEDAALKLREDHDDLILAFTRLAAETGHKVAACGSGEYFTQLDVDLPTGAVRFFVDNDHGPLLAGLPYGISDTKGPIDRETQSLRLTGAYHPDIDQAPIPEPMTPDRVLSILDPTPAPPPPPLLDLSHIRFAVPQAKSHPVDASTLRCGGVDHTTMNGTAS